MAPTLRPGDVILAVSEPDSQVSAGQVLAFHPPYDPSIVVVHRIIQVVHHGNKVEIRTQGDDNNAPDQWTAVLEGTSAWRVSWVLPSAGYVAIWATYPWIHLLALLDRHRDRGLGSAEARLAGGAEMIPLIGNRRRAWLLAAGVAVLALGQSGGAFAMFTDSTTAGPGSFQTGTLPTPGPASRSAMAVAPAARAQTNVTSSWTGSSALDASGNYLVGGYSVLRSASSSGPYSSAGTVTGSPPPTTYTDTSPSGASTPLVYVSAGNGATTAQSINSSTYAAATVTLSGAVGDEPNALQVTPDGSKLVVAEGAAHQVQIVSTATGAVTGTVSIPAVGATPSEPNAVAVNPAGTTAWIVDAANARVYPLSLATSTLGGAITVGAQGDPTAMVVTPNGAQVFVADYRSHQVSAINTSTDSVTNIAIGGTTGTPIALAVTPNSGHVYVADQANSQIDDITTSSDTVSTTIPVPSLADNDGFVANGGDPNILAVTPDGSKLYVASLWVGGSVEDITVTSTATRWPTTIALPPGGVDGVPLPQCGGPDPERLSALRQRLRQQQGGPDRREHRHSSWRHPAVGQTRETPSAWPRPRTARRCTWPTTTTPP
jgi:predicted ribosomally synthesized peptide with SipW-like signal peptide